MLDFFRKYRDILIKMMMFIPLSALAVDKWSTFVTLNIATVILLYVFSITATDKKSKIRVALLFTIAVALLGITLFLSIDKRIVFICIIVCYGFVIFGPNGKNFGNSVKKILIVGLSFISMEFLNGSIFTLIGTMDGISKTPYNFGILLNICVISLVYMILSGIFKKKNTGMYLSAIGLCILSIVNFFVVEWTHQSLVLSDIIKLKTAMTVAGNQSFTKEMLIKLIIGIILWGIIFFIIHLCKVKNAKSSIVGVVKTSFVFIIVVLLGMFSNRALLNFNGGQVYGTITNIILSNKASFKEPKNKVSIKYEKSQKDNVNNNKPNIVVIMSEAFSDLSYSSDKLKISKDYMPYFRQLCKKYPSGIAYSSVYGNNTVTSEAEFLTGTTSLFSTEGAKLWREYVTKDTKSIVSDLNKQGYNTYGIHPGYSFSYNRSIAWANLGFNKLYFLESFENLKPEMYRDLISDKQDYKYIIASYKNNKKTGKPFFCFNVSIQNHAAYKENLSSYNFDKFTTNITNNETRQEAENYSSLMKKTDDDLKILINYFKKQKEETIILFFGDHQPMFAKDIYTNLNRQDADSLSLDESTKFYKVPYMVWSNTKINKTVPKVTSINYLSTILYDIGDIKKPWNILFNDKLMNKYPVITSNFIIKNNKVISNNEINEKINEKVDKKNWMYNLKKYQSITYNLLMNN